MRCDILALVGLAGLLGCGSPGDGRVVGGGSGATSIAVPRPSFTLTDTDGKPFDFRARTTGRLTFLQFGYTRCPDVCPVQMANLVAALHQVPPGDRMGIDVIFVSVDPDRDSLPVLRKWLDSFDQSVIGLTGSRAALDSAQRAVGFAPAVVQPAAAGRPDAMEVLHAAPIIVFTADDTAHVMFPFGTRQADWERDMPALLQKRSRVQPPGGTVGVASGGAGGGAGGIAFSRVYFVAPAGDTPAAVFLVAHNTGAQPDTIVALEAGDLGPASVHMTMTDEHAGTTMMHSVEGVAIPASGTLRFAPGGYHGMVGPLRRRVVRGDRVQLVIRLSRAGAVAVSAVVISYSDVDTATAAR